MAETEKGLQKLRASIDAGLRFKENQSDFTKYISSVVGPNLEAVANEFSLTIEPSHRLSQAQEEQETLVVHYTSIATLMSMFTSLADGKDVAFRLYDSAHFNDPDEGNYLVRKLLQSDTLTKTQNSSHAYVASFILGNKDMADNLVFWRTYGREGQGCSMTLGITRSLLRRVFYGVKKEAEDTIKLLRPIVKELNPLLGPLVPDVRSDLEKYLSKGLERIRYLYKSEAYDYETECRAVMYYPDVCPDSIRYEYKEQAVSEGQVRHYYEPKELDVKAMMSSSGSMVTLGPRVSDSNDLINSLMILKQRASLDNLEIRPSGIRYRKP